MLRSLVRYALVVGLIAVSARVSATIPGTSVPQSAQTLAVVLAGAFLGARGGALALALYLLAGGAGVPVFADGASGWAHLAGPTGGYLAGFVLAAGIVGGLANREHMARLPAAVAAMALGHAVILGPGWLRLAWSLGPHEAFAAGVAPFLLGGLAKSIVGGVAAWVWTRRGFHGSAGIGSPRRWKSGLTDP